jgi:hypothetical protein
MNIAVPGPNDFSQIILSLIFLQEEKISNRKIRNNNLFIVNGYLDRI